MLGMPQARIGDMSMGHWVGPFYFPPTPLIEGSPDTFSCCIPASRVTDAAAPHIGWLFGVIPIPAVIHYPKAATGAPCTFINELAAFRVEDEYDCGDIQAEGCPEHLVGEVCGAFGLVTESGEPVLTEDNIQIVLE